MKIEHENWSEIQLGNVLYWQGSIKKHLKDYINKVHGRFFVLGCGSGFKLPFQKKVNSLESVGIDVFATLKNNGIDFEIKPINKIVLVCLLCFKNSKSYY